MRRRKSARARGRHLGARVASGGRTEELDQTPQPSDHVLTVLGVGETVCQTGELPKTF